MAETPFIHLRVHSSFSLVEGAIKPKELVKLCVKNRMPAVAVTDTNNMFGALEFSLAAADSGVQPIMGLQLDIARPDATQVAAGSRGRAFKAEAPIVLLARDAAGYQNLQNLTSQAFFESEGAARLTLDKLEGQTTGLICLTGGPCGLLGAMVQAGQRPLAEAALTRLQALFPDALYIEMQRHESLDEDSAPWGPEAATEATFLDWATMRDIPLVATNDCQFANRAMYEAHDALLCIAGGRYVAENDRPRLTPEHYFKSADEMRALFADLPEAIANTAVIARRCAFMPKMVKPILPHYPDLPAGSTADQEMARQSREGLADRAGQAAVRDGCGGVRGAAGVRAGRDLQHGLRRLLPDRRRLHQMVESQQHSGGAGPGVGRGLGRRLGTDDHRPRPAALRPAVRAVFESGSRLDARLRHRLLPGPAGRGDPLCL